MISKRKWINHSFLLARQLLLAQWMPLGALFLISCMVDIYSEDAMQLLTPSQESARLVIQFGVGIWDLVEGVLTLLVLSWAIPLVRKPQTREILEKPFAEPYFGSFMAEYLRQLAQILMWSLLLLLPGFLRYCQLLFVPLIALFSRSYRAGQVDALRLSERLVKGRLFMIMSLMLVTIGLQMGFEFLPELVPGLHIYPVRILCEVLSFLVNVWAYALIFILFEQFIAELEPEVAE